MKNYKNSYLYEEEIGKVNSWEYYFEQPTSMTLEQAYCARKYILSDGKGKTDAPNISMGFLNGEKGELSKWKRIFEEYIHIKPEVLMIMENEYERIFNPDDRVLAVLCRGTDYLSLKPRNHPVQPDPMQVAADAEIIIKKYNINKVFLASEDKEIYEIFKNKFGDKVRINNKEFKDYNGLGLIGDCVSRRNNDKYLSGVEYLTTIYIASKCNCFLAGRVNGTIGVMLMTDGFEYTQFYDLGTY